MEESAPPGPTQGVRIVEFELTDVNIEGKPTTIDIELWDCSGDHRQVECVLFLLQIGLLRPMKQRP